MAATFQNAVLTGACGGLGQALARELIGQGAAVALVGLHLPTLQALAALAPGRCAVYTPDVSDSIAMQAMAADWMAQPIRPDFSTLLLGRLRQVLPARSIRLNELSAGPAIRVGQPVRAARRGRRRARPGAGRTWVDHAHS